MFLAKARRAALQSPRRAALGWTAALIIGLSTSALFAQSTTKVLYLNFDGVTLQGMAECSDAVRNCSGIVNGGTGSSTVPPFSGSPDIRDAIVTEVKRLYAPFNVHLVTARPAQGPYSMCVIGGRPRDIGIGDVPAAGVALIDCNDDLGPSDVSFAFSDVVHNNSHSVAVTVAQETAHAYGLSHVEDPTDVLYPTLMGFGSGFQDRESRVCNIDGYTCKTAAGCDRLSTQNSFRLLLEKLGAANANTQEKVAPTVAIRTPANGATVGPEFRVEFDVGDNVGVARVELYADGAFVGGSLAPPFPIDLPKYFLGEGAHRLKANAYDAAHNKGVSAEVNITVKGSIGQSCSGPAACPSDLMCTAGVCTRECMDKSACPTAYACKMATAGKPGLCVSNAPAGDSGCQMGSRGSVQYSLWAIAFGMLVALRGQLQTSQRLQRLQRLRRRRKNRAPDLAA